MPSILAANALTTYASAKARLVTNGQNAINDDEHQTLIEGMINAVSDDIVSYCGREFHKVSRVEQHEPPEGERIIVDVTPVASSPAPTATLDGSTVALTVEDAKLGFLRVLGGWGGADYREPVPNSVALATRPGTGERVAVVTYTGGYVTPHQAADLNVSPSAATDSHTLWEPDEPVKAGTLSVTTTADTTHTHVTVAWNDGAASTLINAAEVLTAALPKTYNLGDLDADLAGFFLVIETAALTTASSVAYTVAAGESTRDLPWNIEEAALISVACLWRMMRAGYAADAMPELNTAIGRGEGGILPDIAKAILQPYRRTY